MLELTLVRHAKSSWNEPELTDYERPLKKRGIHDAELIGQWLTENGIVPTAIVTSGAQRATQTARILAKALDLPLKAVQETQKLYFSGSQKHLKLVNQLDEKLRSVLIVGHNPVISTFAEKLSGKTLGEVPTAATANIQFNTKHWRNIEYGQGHLKHFIVPKSLRRKD